MPDRGGTALCRRRRLPAPRPRSGPLALMAEAWRRRWPRRAGAGGRAKDRWHRCDAEGSARGGPCCPRSLSKAHGKAVCCRGPAPAGWAATPRQVEGGFPPCPGCFPPTGRIAARRLLAAALPAKRLGPKVADLGAGWGYLSRAILARETGQALDLVEAERDALDCARVSTSRRPGTVPLGRCHHASARENLLDAVVMNPPFHTGRAADPALGIAFLRGAPHAGADRRAVAGGQPASAL
jgi:16S rRNA (guanine1207-N2)-methyltransferase